MIGGPGKDNTVYGTAHWDNAGNHASYGGKLSLAAPKILADEFHVFSIVWTPTAITMVLRRCPISGNRHHPHRTLVNYKIILLIFNVAVGGTGPVTQMQQRHFPSE
jgi:hypothetical protein